MDLTSRKILIIDDTPSSIKVAMGCLETGGYEIVIAHDGRTGLTIAQEEQPDLILMDVIMPEMDGFETCRLLKANDQTHNIPVIFMTALLDAEHKVRGFEAGGVDYVTKPIQFEELLARVRTQIDLHHMQHELEIKNKNLQWARANLEQRVAERTAELRQANIKLESEIEERKRAEDALRQLNETLEQRVAERTAELENRNQEIRDLAHKTIQAMENDRMALARELHDSIGGTLAAIIYQLETQVENLGQKMPSIQLFLEKMIEHLGSAVQESRRITKQLRPSVLDDFGLLAAIQEHVKDYTNFNPQIQIQKHIDICEEHLADEIKTVLYRVLQEALNNVSKHSQADKVVIRCWHDKRWIRMQITDNGLGFDLDEVLGAGTMAGYGIHSMIERVEICKGKLQIESEIGKGTTVTASMPIKPT